MPKVYCQNKQQQLETSFLNGDAVLLSTYFGHKVTLNINGEENEYSLSPARNRMDTFFRSYKTTSFSVIFQGGKNNSNFLIGRMVTDKATFRVNILFRKTETGEKIHLIRIEKENGTGF